MNEFTAPACELADVGFKAPPRNPNARAFVHAVLWLPVLVVVSAFTPRLEAIYRDFGIPLSGLTVGVIRLSHLMRPAVVVAPLALAALVAADVAVAQALAGDARRLRAWSVAMTVLPLAALALVVVGLFFPLVQLVDRLSG